MMYLDVPPRLIGTEVFSAMPDRFRRKGTRTDWADANATAQAQTDAAKFLSTAGTATPFLPPSLQVVP